MPFAILLLALVAALAAAPVRKAAPRKARPVAAPVKPQPAPVTRSGPLDLPLLQLERRAIISHTPLTAGGLEMICDSNRHTGADMAAPPDGEAFWQVALDRPRALDTVDVQFSGDARYRWSLEAADSPADMKSSRGSYRMLVPLREVAGGTPDQASFTNPRASRVYRLSCRRALGVGPISLSEWALWTPQELRSITLHTFTGEASPGTVLPIRADALFEGGARQNVTSEVAWVVDPPSRGRVDSFARFEAREPGLVRLFATHEARQFGPLPIEILPTGAPDWDVTHVERQPRLDLADPKAALQVGQSVYWFAHVRNYGTADAPAVSLEWRVDGKTIHTDRLPKLERFGQTEAILRMTWDGLPHRVEFVVDPPGEVAEASEDNNKLAFSTHARPLGLWVEDSTLQYFHRHQRALGIGSNSWEDWAQRQVRIWNEAAVKQGDPFGWRIDRIQVVGDGMLPMAGGSPIAEPDRRDTTVAAQLGFPAYDPVRSPLYRRTADPTPENPFFYQADLWESLRARGLHAPQLQGSYSGSTSIGK